MYEFFICTVVNAWWSNISNIQITLIKPWYYFKYYRNEWWMMKVLVKNKIFCFILLVTHVLAKPLEISSANKNNCTRYPWAKNHGGANHALTLIFIIVDWFWWLRVKHELKTASVFQLWTLSKPNFNLFGFPSIQEMYFAHGSQWKMIQQWWITRRVNSNV